VRCTQQQRMSRSSISSARSRCRTSRPCSVARRCGFHLRRLDLGPTGVQCVTHRPERRCSQSEIGSLARFRSGRPRAVRLDSGGSHAYLFRLAANTATWSEVKLGLPRVDALASPARDGGCLRARPQRLQWPGPQPAALFVRTLLGAVLRYEFCRHVHPRQRAWPVAACHNSPQFLNSRDLASAARCPGGVRHSAVQSQPLDSQSVGDRR
jgi:hypothetical protein